MNTREETIEGWQKNLERLKEDEDEIKKCLKDPLYYYNEYQRPPGHKVLDQEEFDAMIEKFKQENNEKELKKLNEHRAEREFKGRPDILDHTHDVWEREKRMLQKQMKAEKKKNSFSSRLMEKFRKGNKKD